MNSKIRLVLLLKNKEYEIPCQFKGLSDINQDIYTQLLFSPNHTYIVSSDVSEEIFQSFLDYWIQQKKTEINSKNVYEYLNLSDEFQIMQDLIKAAKLQWNQYERNLDMLSSNSTSDKHIVEEDVSQHLDEYIEKYGKNLMNLNIQTLHNIFFNNSRRLTKFNEAYHLIDKHYEETGDESIFILLPSLDFKSLNQHNLSDSLSRADDHFGFTPRTEFSYLHSVIRHLENEMKARLDDIANDSRIKQLEKSIEEQTTVNQNLTSKIESISVIVEDQKTIIQKQASRIEQLEKSVEQQAKTIQNLDSKIEQQINARFEHLAKQCDDQKTIIQKQASRIEQLEKPVEQQTNARSDQQSDQKGVTQKQEASIEQLEKPVEQQANARSDQQSDQKGVTQKQEASIEQLEKPVEQQASARSDQQSDQKGVTQKQEASIEQLEKPVEQQASARSDQHDGQKGVNQKQESKIEQQEKEQLAKSDDKQKPAQMENESHWKLYIKAVEGMDVANSSVKAPNSFLQMRLNKSNEALRTKTIHGTRTPVWNEQFEYQINSLYNDKLRIDLCLTDFYTYWAVSSYVLDLKRVRVGQKVDNWYQFSNMETKEKKGKIRLVVELKKA